MPGLSHGAVNQIRTGDLLLGKETLYQLSYYRISLTAPMLPTGLRAVNGPAKALSARNAELSYSAYPCYVG